MVGKCFKLKILKIRPNGTGKWVVEVVVSETLINSTSLSLFIFLLPLTGVFPTVKGLLPPNS